MEPKIKSSFIPKTPVTSSTAVSRTRLSRGGGVLFTFSLVIFLLTFAGWGAVFGYNLLLEKTIEEKSILLEQERVAFEPSLIEELLRLDERFTVAESLLQAHLAPSVLFEILSRNTLRTVQFNELTYTWLPDGRVALSMNGTARNFASLALQADAFDLESAIRNPIFSDFGLDEFGNVTFVVESEINPLALSYIDLVERTTPINTDFDTIEGVFDTGLESSDTLNETSGPEGANQNELIP